MIGVGAMLLATVALQAAAESSATGDTFGLGTLIVQLGLSGVFLWQWRSERDQRIRRDDQVIGILERQGPVLADAVDTLKAVQDAQRSMVMQSSTEWDRMAEQLRVTHAALEAETRARREGSGL